MLICKGEKSYRCSKVRTDDVAGGLVMRFSILEPISPYAAAILLEDNTFYFYDEVLKGKFSERKCTKIVGLSITYDADSTCKIKIKLTKGVVDNDES